MVQYKRLIKILFNSWFKTHQLSTRIIEEWIRANNIKKNEANYRRFQRHVQQNYKPTQQIQPGLILYYHNEAQKQYQSILHFNYPLADKGFKLNPFFYRHKNFYFNRIERQKIDFTDFAKEKKIKG